MYFLFIEIRFFIKLIIINWNKFLKRFLKFIKKIIYNME